MPKTEVIFFQDTDGSVPVIDWLDEQLTKVQDKLVVRVERLEKMGHELRRPEAAHLRDGIYELRAKHLRVNYRVLYFFHEQKAVLSNGLTKEAAVPDSDINIAIGNMKKYVADPKQHTHVDEE